MPRLLNIFVLVCVFFQAPIWGDQNPAQGARGAASAEGGKAAASDAERRKEAFEIVWRTVKDYHYDPTFGGVDWDAVREEFAPRVARAQSDRELHWLLQEMLNRLGQSHFVIVPPESIPAVAPVESDSTDTDGSPEEEEGASPPSLSGLNVTERLTHGIGIDLRVINGSAVITRVQPMSTAARAGLRPGFIIRSVDGRLMSGIIKMLIRAAAYQPALLHQIPEEIIVGFFNGPRGTPVRIAYLDARARLRRASVRREKLRGEMSPPLQYLPPQFVEFESKRLRRGIGYIRFNVFAVPVMEKFCAALRSMSDAPGLIIDMRGNRGGILGLIYGMSGLLGTGPVSFGVMRTRAGAVEFGVIPQKNPYRGQLVVLIDGTSQSASEIFASGLQEAGRAVIIGENSAGSTLPSVAKELPTGAILQYAFADFKTRYGNRLEGQGVRPDIHVPLDRRALLAGRDPQLEAALDAVQPQVGGDVVTIIAPAPGGGSAGLTVDLADDARGGERKDTAERTQGVEVSADPLVEQIIEKYVQAIGGRAAVEKISSRVSRGAFRGSFSGIAINGTVEIVEKAPDKSVTNINIPNMGIIRRGFTGTYGYEQISLFGFREMRGAELDDIRLASNLHWSINLRRFYPKMTLRGKEKVGDSEAYVIEATPVSGNAAKFYFDVQTGLLTRRDDTYFEDYRQVEGVMLPFRLRTVNTLITLTDVKHNLAVDDTKFAEQKDCFTR